MREIRTSGSMSGGGKQSHGTERGTGTKAKAAGNRHSPRLKPLRLLSTLLRGYI